MPLLFPTAPALGQIYEFSGRSWIFNGVGWAVHSSPRVSSLPTLADNNSTFNDEGEAATGWTPTNATMTSSNSYLRATKVATGSSVATKLLTMPSTDRDYIVYGKMRARNASDSCAVLWLLNGSKEVSIWFGSANASSVITPGAVSICGTTGTSTRNVASVASGLSYDSTPFEFALQFDQKFQTLTCWTREADGRWKWRARVACSWFSAATIDLVFTSSSAAGSWVEFDYLSVCRPNLVVMGDSIGEGKTLFSPNPTLNLTNDESTWMRHARLYPLVRNNLVVNKCVGGNTSPAMQSRITDVTNTGARVVFQHASSNDEASGVSLSQRTTSLQAIINAEVTAGMSVVLLNSMTATASAPDNTAPRALMAYTRAWWDNDRAAVTGVSAAVDIALAVKASGSNYMDPAKAQSDGIHPNLLGQPDIGAAVAAA